MACGPELRKNTQIFRAALEMHRTIASQEAVITEAEDFGSIREMIC